MSQGMGHFDIGKNTSIKNVLVFYFWKMYDRI